ncbi:uncharacterized protein At4g17910 [Nilaparvata lugens]|uniref:uncharacterized protein At4g17910 n=1 Tax=Nilaparvata lugens TaxID=108931 RepID=UPI00193D4B04|nr:uncharacterized protein At4g17910 [Nilaparvata lugens]XP_039280443.1 uncharacterized protein At4g17910 [Nilaparvata lugens]
MEEPASFTSYRQLHENFMHNNSGSSLEETIHVQTPLPILIFFSLFVTNYLSNEIGAVVNRKLFEYCSILIELVLIVVLQILIFTSVISDSFCLVLLVVAFFLVLYIIFTYLKDSILQKCNSIILKRSALTGKRPYITYFRTSVNLTTTICILAVDFTVFPRSLSKTETYGFSLMDTGVGYFVVCNGLVGNNVELFNYRHSRIHLFFKLIGKNCPLFILGLVRFFTVSNLDYQQHVSEYGVHWNFFITLAFTKVFASLLLTFFKKSFVRYVALALMILHQCILIIGVEKWVLSDLPRNSFISANREGIVSLLGYVSLYLIAVDLGIWLKSTNSTFEKDIGRVIKLMFHTFFLYIIVHVLNIFFNCSRRLANVTYVVWINMLSTYLLLLCLIVELIMRLNRGPGKTSPNNGLVPIILEIVNSNALTFFLVANLLTGLINLCIETIHVDSFYSIFIIISYELLLCVTFFILHVFKWKLY